MRIAMLSPIAWRTPPRHYGPWENVVSLLTEGLVSRGIDVTLYASGDSITGARLKSVCLRGYEENTKVIPKVEECLHISELFEQAEEFDLIHNHFDFLPLSYSSMTTTPLITTIHGFSSPAILPVYKKYNNKVFYISISDADRAPSLDYLATIHHGINLRQFTYQAEPENYLLFFGRIHQDKGAREAIEIALASGIKLLMAGIVQDEKYFQQFVVPKLQPGKVEFLGSVGPDRRNTLLGGAKALLHPIYFNEPFGLSVVEAMACGTPVIAFNRGSMPELIDSGKNGFLVDDVDQAVGAVARLKDISRGHCRRHVEQFFSVERMVDDYINAYQQVIDKAAPKSHYPWGYQKTLSDNKKYSIKETVIFPGKDFSPQSHPRRVKQLVVVEGTAVAKIGDRTLCLGDGQSVDIPHGATYRMANPSSRDNMIYIETQAGGHAGEQGVEQYKEEVF
ncbi:mannose-6-phosphate isomerase, type 2 [Alteromonadaceae bacterium Bs31]|nr:mannose-6-phosphate isomerase, type 2 [Alteromonadaceae bacterium Bs31]